MLPLGVTATTSPGGPIGPGLGDPGGGLPESPLGWRGVGGVGDLVLLGLPLSPSSV